MKHQKKLLVGALTAGIIGLGGVATTALAATNGSDYPPIVQKIADKFNLKPADVQAVFEQQHEDRQKNHQAKLEETLNQAVKDGKLTETQKDKLLAKLESLKDEIKDEIKENRQEHHENHQKIKSELEAWAKANGIDNLDDILPKPHHLHRHI